MRSIDEFAADFTEEPGYLDFARIGPVGRAVQEEERLQSGLLGRARFGTLDSLESQDARVLEAIASVTGFRPEQIVFQPNTSQGLMRAMFGLTGGVAMSAAEFPSTTFAAVRAAAALGALTPVWLDTDSGQLTPGNIRDQLTPAITAVALSLVDFRTGYLVDLEGIRQVIGDRLLIVDAIQGFGVVDAPYELADVVVSGGQKWVRSGWGTGFLALSERALNRLTPVFSGFPGTDADGMVLDEVPPPSRAARGYTVSIPDRIAQGRFAAALEQIAEAGVPAINTRLAEKVARTIGLADEYAVPVVSPRSEAERAGIVVLEPAADQLTLLTAALFNHGISATTREGRVRLSPHVSTGEESFEMLRACLLGFASAVRA